MRPAGLDSAQSRGELRRGACNLRARIEGCSSADGVIGATHVPGDPRSRATYTFQ